MTADLPRNTRRLIARSTCPRELTDFAEWLSSEGYTTHSRHIHLMYCDQALARLARPHDPGARDMAEVERAFAPGAGPPARKKHLEAAGSAYARFLRARNRLLEPPPQDRFASLRCEYGQYLIEVRGLSASSTRSPTSRPSASRAS